VLMGWHEPDLGGSEYLKTLHGKVAGRPPTLDFAREKAVQNAVRTLIRRGLVSSAHDVSDGGIAATLAECSITGKKGMHGVEVELDSKVRPDVLLFGESAATIVVSCNPKNLDSVLSISKELGAPARRIGKVGGRRLAIKGMITIEVEDLYRRWATSFEKVVGG